MTASLGTAWSRAAVRGVATPSEFHLLGRFRGCACVRSASLLTSLTEGLRDVSEESVPLAPWPGDTQEAVCGVPAAVVAPWEAGPSVGGASGFGVCSLGIWLSEWCS